MPEKWLCLLLFPFCIHAAEPGIHRPKVQDDPLLLFYASFDEGIDRADQAAGDPEFVPGVYDRSPLWKLKGMQDWQRSKDYKNYRAVQKKEGKSGTCVSINLGQGHRFRSLGNSNVRRGTMSFWFKLGRPLGTSHLPILELDGPGVSCRGRNKRLCGYVVGRTYGAPADACTQDEWHHMAIAYDCCLGYKVYLDGKLAERPHWDPKADSWQTDALFADLLSLGCSAYQGSTGPLDIDEVRIFSRPLCERAIECLASMANLPYDNVTEPAPSEEVFRKHRLAELGWDQEDELLACRAGNTTPLVIRQIGVESALGVKRWTYGPVDGIPSTRWPSGYQGYRIPGEGLHLRLEKGASVDYMTLHGNFDGLMYAGDAIDQPPSDAALLQIKSPGRRVRKRFGKPIQAEKVSFFRSPFEMNTKQDNLGRTSAMPDNYIYELSFYRLGGSVEAGEARVFHLSSSPHAPETKWVLWALQSHYEPADRVALALNPDPPAGAGGVRLKALRHAHFFIPPQKQDVPMTGLRFHFLANDLKQDSRLHVQVHNPVDITRNLLDFDLRLAVGEKDADGIMRFDVTIDTQDFLLPAGEPVWITLTPERDLDLVWNGTSDATQVAILTGPKDHVIAEHNRNMLNYAKDRFIHVSEPRPWGHVPMDVLAERLEPFRQLHFALCDLRKNAPEDEKLRGLWTWTHPTENPDMSWVKPPPLDGAPEWAVYTKEAMKKYRAFILWWIDNRQIPSGLFGSGHGDDTDLVQDWLSVGMICDPDGKIRESVRRLADYCWNEGPLTRGINTVFTDTLHCYEEGVNVLPHVAHLYYGNPVYLEHLMESTRTTRDELTYLTKDGRRFFKSCWYGATYIETEHQYGRDFPGNTLMLHPALYLMYYSRNEGAVKLLKEWGGNWAGIQEEAYKKQGLKADYPFQAQYPTGKIVKTVDRYISGYGYLDLCLGMYALTQEEKYFIPIRTWIDNGDLNNSFVPDLFGLRDMKEYEPQLRKAVAEMTWDDLRPQMGDDGRDTYSYLAWEMTGDKRYVERAVKEAWKRITVLFPMHTWAEQSADRVAVSKTLVDRLYLGGTPGKRNKLWPTHTVGWKGFSEEFAAWVLKTSPDTLRVWIYNFESRPQSGEIRPWGLTDGNYSVQLGFDENSDEKSDQQIWEKTMTLSRNTPIPIVLPPRRLVVLEANQVRPGASIFDLPDLAVVTTDMTHNAKAGKLAFVIHNVGSAAAQDIDVIVEVDGRQAASHRIRRLDAPADLMARIVKFEQTISPGAKKIVIAADPQNAISEICEENNQAVWGGVDGQ
ncbi:MAG: CARDB domain-containing protein [Planctomycetota bacterium]